MADEPVKENEEVKETEEVKKTEEVKEKVSNSSEKTNERRTEQDRRRQPRSQSQSRFRQQQDRGVRGPSNFGRRRFQPRRKVCMFCVDSVKSIDWKNVDQLRRFINNNGSIRARRKTGTCARHQRQLAVAVKRARHIALVPFTDEHTRLQGR
jgi:small subunit ribosomal protein S18